MFIRRSHIYTFIFLLLASGIIVLPVVAHAQVTGSSIIDSFLGLTGFKDLFNSIFAYVGEAILYVSSVFLSLCGIALNFSLNVTLQIHQFVDNIPAIYTVWKAIRDISGMFIIFSLLVMAFQMILDVKSPSFNEIMKNVIIAGILINFSFFFVGIMIDASNLISMQIFRQMTPNIVTINQGQKIGDVVQQTIKKGNIADIFLSSLNITQVYENRGQLQGVSNDNDKTPDWLRILIVSIAGAGMMITTGLSFLAAAVAFLARLAILVFILGFSPLWFAAMVVPGGELKKYANDGWGLLKGQLLFMPAYLLLMYFALQIVSSTNFKGTSITAGTGFWYSFLGLIINCIFVIIFLNIPLVAALQIGAKVPDFMQFKAGGLWKKFGSFTGRRTLGRTAYALNESGMMKSFVGRNPALGTLASTGLTKISKAGFGVKKGSYEDVLSERKKSIEKMHKKLGDLDESKYDSTIKSPVDGKTQLERAKDRAKAAQANYRDNLDNQSFILAAVLDNRADRQSAHKLKKDVEKKEKKSREKDIKKQKKADEEELARLKNKVRSDSQPVGFAPAKPPTYQDMQRIEQLEKNIEKHSKDLDEIEDMKEEERLEKMAGKVADKSKKEDGGGEGKKG